MNAKIGLGYLPSLHHEVEILRGLIDFWEVLPEGFFGGRLPQYLDELSSVMTIFHGTQLDLLGTSGCRSRYINELAKIASVCNPDLITDHMALMSFEQMSCELYIPPKYNKYWVDHAISRINYLSTKINLPTSKLAFENIPDYINHDNDISEGEFFHQIWKATGVGTIINVNSLIMSSIFTGKSIVHIIDGYHPSSVVSVTYVPINEMNQEIVKQVSGDITKLLSNTLFELKNKLCPSKILIQRRFPKNRFHYIENEINFVKEIML